MKLLKEWIDERINDKDIIYLDFNEFGNVETYKKVNWKKRKITVELKLLNNLNSIIFEHDSKELIIKVILFLLIFIRERRLTCIILYLYCFLQLKALCIVYFHSNINRFYGITKGL
jgi:hypothetical protein